MATTKELYELLLDMADCIDDINCITESEGYKLEYDDEKIIFKILREYSDRDNQVIECEMDMHEMMCSENFNTLQNIWVMLKQLYKDLENIEEVYAHMRYKLNNRKE